MAKAKSRRKTKANADQFKGNKKDGDKAKPNADLENVAKLANSAKANGATNGGHNSSAVVTGISDEELQQLTQQCIDADAEVQTARKLVDKKMGVYRNALKVAKSKGAPKEEIEEYIKMRKFRAKFGDGAIISQHRNLGRIGRVMGDQTIVKFNLYSLLEEGDALNGVKQEGSEPIEKLDAELQGQNAFRHGNPRSGNKYTPGSEEYAQWDTGWLNAEYAFMNPDNPVRPVAPAAEVAETAAA